MANAGYCVSNLAAIGTAITSSSADTSYPLANLTDGRPSKTFRFTGKASESVVIDFGSATNLTFASLLNHNLTNAATITLQANATNSWGAPSYSQAMTWAAASLYMILNQTYRWWRITFADAGNPSSYIELGELFMGIVTTLNHNFHYGSAVSQDYINIENKTPYQQPWTYGLNDYAVLDYQFLDVSDTDQAQYAALMAATHGNLYPLVIIPDTAINICYFGKLQPTYQHSYKNFQTTDIKLTFTEIPNGVLVNS